MRLLAMRKLFDLPVVGKPIATWGLSDANVD